MSSRSGLALLLALVASGCGGVSAADDAGPGAAPTAPEPPEIPWLDEGAPPIAAPGIPWLEAGAPPIAWACPVGWREVTADGVATCEPYPADGPSECDAGDAHFPGEAGCASIGRACGEETFPAVDDLAAPVFVRADAEPGGDGSEATPFATVADALGVATSGDTLVLAAGSYVVDRAWPDGVSLRGRCVGDTVLAAEEGSERTAVLEVDAHDDAIRIEDVTVGPSPLRAVRVSNAGEAVSLEGVLVDRVTDREDGPTGAGAVLVTEAGELDARSLVVRDTRARRGGLFGRGVQVQAGGQLTLRRAVLARNRETAIRAFGEGSVAVVEDAVIRDTLPQESNGLGGAGAGAFTGARLELRRALIEQSRQLGVVATEAGTQLVLEDLVVRDTLGLDDGVLGFGLIAFSGAAVEVRRALLERNRRAGVTLEREGTTATLEDVVVRDTLAQAADEMYGRGLEVSSGASAVLRRALLVRNRQRGASAEGAGTTLALEDVSVSGTLPQESDGTDGWGVAALDGAELDASRTLLVVNRDVGLRIAGTGTEATVEDLVVRETRATAADQPGGGGIAVEDAAQVAVRRALVEGNRDVGVLAAGTGTSVAAEDLTVTDTRAREDNRGGGVGLLVDDGGRIGLSRALLDDSREAGLRVSGANSSAVIDDVAIRGAGEADGAPRRGLEVLGADRVDLRRALIDEARGVAMHVRGAQVVGEDLVVRDTRPTFDGLGGRGLSVEAGAAVDLRRLLVEACLDHAVLVDGDGSAITLSASELRGTESRMSDGRFGRGLTVQNGASADLFGALLAENREVGLAVLGRGSAARLENVEVRDTTAPACAGDCDDQVQGANLGSYRDGDILARSFELSGAARCGVQVGAGAVELTNGTVSDQPIGACLLSDEYPLELLREGVRYLRVDSRFEVVDFPEAALAALLTDD